MRCSTVVFTLKLLLRSQIYTYIKYNYTAECDPTLVKLCTNDFEGNNNYYLKFYNNYDTNIYF